MYTISSAELHEAADIVAIHQRAFEAEGRLSGDMAIPPLAETVESIRDHIQHQTVLTARIEGEIVGVVRGVELDAVCTIRGLCIEPAHQGGGIGSALLGAIQSAHPQATEFVLTTNSLMPLNVRFYERHGYFIKSLEVVSAKITLAHMAKLQSPVALPPTAEGAPLSQARGDSV